MNKKVLSAILFSALFAGTGTFTSCIENDEPQGIEAIRTAKAELISAKAAVEAAKVAQVQAEAALAQARAELIKAEAQAVALRAQMEKAESDAEIAVIEAQVARLKAETEAFIQNAEATAKQLEVSYQQALIRLEQAKLALNGEKQNALAQVNNYYENAVEDYNNKYFAYLDAARAYNKALAELEDNDVNDIQTKRRLEKNVEDQKQYLALAQETLAELKGELAEAEGMTASDLQVKFDKLSAEIEALEDSVAYLELERAEVKDANRAEYEKRDELWAAHIESRNTEATIPALTITDWKGNEVEIFSEDYEYSLNNSGRYAWAVNRLNNRIYDFKGYIFDENDVAWTEQTILDLKNAIEAKEGPKAKFEEAKAKWEAAAKAYKTTDGTVDETAYLTYATLKDSIDAYNASIPAVTAAVADEKAKKTAWEAAVKANNDAKTAQQNYDAAVKAANKKVADLAAAQKKELEDKAKELEAEKIDLAIAYEEAKVETMKAEKDLNDNPKIEAYKKLYDAAVKAEAAAEKAYLQADAAAEKALSEMQVAHEKAMISAKETQKIELAEANVAYMKEIDANGGLQKDPNLKAAADAAFKAYQTAQTVTVKAKDATDSIHGRVMTAWNKYQIEVEYRASYPANEYKALDIVKVSELTREEAKYVVEVNSNTVWGSKIAANDYDMWQGISEAYLINGLTKADMDAIIESRQKAWDTDFGYIYKVSDGQGNEWDEYQAYDNESGWMYQYFGLFGQYQADVTNLENIQAAITNLDAAKASVAALETALAELEAGYEALETANEAAYDAFVAQDELIAELEASVQEKINAVYEDMSWTKDLRWAYHNAISSLEGYDACTFAESLENLIQDIKNQIKNQESTIYFEETSLMVAEKNLADWNEGEFNAVDNAKYAMDRAEFIMNAAKAKVDAAKAALDKAIETLKATEE